MTFPNPRLHSHPAERRLNTVLFSESFINRENLDDNGLISFSASPEFAVSRGMEAETDTPGHSCIFGLRNITTGGQFSVFVDIEGMTPSTSAAVVFVLASFGLTQIRFQGSQLLYGPSYTPLSGAVFDDGGRHYLCVNIHNGLGYASIFFDDISDSVSGTGSTSGANQMQLLSDRVCKINRVLVFGGLISEDDFTTLKTENWTDLIADYMFSLWRCDAFGNDTVGHNVRNVGLTKPLAKGDQDGGLTQPIFVEVDRDSYYNMSSPSYLSGFPALPESYTLSACVSVETDDGNVQEIVQADSDDSFIDLLSSAQSRDFNFLHSLYISDRELSDLKKAHLEYIQTHDTNFCVLRRAAADIVRELVCRVCLNFESPVNPLIDIADFFDGAQRSAVATGATFDSTAKTYSFTNTSDRLNIAHSDLGSDTNDQVLSSFTIIAFGPHLEGSVGGSTVLSKGTDFKFSVTNDRLYFGGTSYADEDGLGDSSMMYAVAGVSGYLPRFFRDDHFIGEGSAVITSSNSNQEDWTFGNNEANSSPFTGSNVRCFMVFNQALTDREIISIYYALQGDHGV